MMGGPASSLLLAPEMATLSEHDKHFLAGLLPNNSLYHRLIVGADDKDLVFICKMSTRILPLTVVSSASF